MSVTSFSLTAFQCQSHHLVSLLFSVSQRHLVSWALRLTAFSPISLTLTAFDLTAMISLIAFRITEFGLTVVSIIAFLSPCVYDTHISNN